MLTFASSDFFLIFKNHRLMPFGTNSSNDNTITAFFNFLSKSQTLYKDIFFIHWKNYKKAIKRSYTCKNEQIDQCCQQLVAMLCCTLSTTVVLHPINNCCQQPLFTVVHVQQPLFNHGWQSSARCFHQLLLALVLCQHRTTIDQTTLINIMNSTSVVEPW